MGIYDSESITNTNLSNTLTINSIMPKDTDFSSYTPDWQKWHGYYRETAKIKAIIDKLADWTAGNGITAKEPKKQKIIDNITGFGKDTIGEIAINLLKTEDICGDSFAHIITNNRKELINLKPLSAGSLKIVTDKYSILHHYEQIETRINPDTKQPETIKLRDFQPEEIFHLTTRIGDENHGISKIESLEDTILFIREIREVQRKTVNRIATPLVLIEADTDNEAKMLNIKLKYEQLISKGEAQVVPKGSIDYKDFSAKQNIDLLPILEELESKIILIGGVPEVILGVIKSKDTEGASKILYLAYEQTIKKKKKKFEEAWKSQIGFEIELGEPPSIDPLILTDMRKGGTSGGAGRLTDTSPDGQNK